jgi:hypothetical protein
MESSHTGTPPKHEKEDDESTVDLSMFDTEDDKSFSIDLKMFNTEDSKSSNPDDCCHLLKRWTQVFKYLVYLLLVS